ncbi:MAG TPA: MoaD/ThiS family protein [Armatimonadota bacterium]|nr:MoaD/ThiS family protein [Armatimonadota bacterium]
MASVHIPSLLQDLTGGADEVTAPGATVGELIEALEERFPGLRDRLCDGRRLRPAVAVWVDGEPSREGLLQALTDHSDVHFLPAISGG